MKVAIMQPYFFPYIGYFQLIHAVDTFVIYDDVNFIKRGWINRNNILIHEKQFLFTIPLKSVSQNKLINQIEIDENLTWKINLLKTIRLAYSKSPFFDQVFPVIKDIIEFEEKNLGRFIIYSLQKICSFLKINTNIILSSDLEKDNTLKGQNKIIEICKKLGTKEYINTFGGQDLYDKETFEKKGILLNFIKTNSIEYTQYGNEFKPWLSIIDIMMFNSLDDIRKMLRKYELL